MISSWHHLFFKKAFIFQSLFTQTASRLFFCPIHLAATLLIVTTSSSHPLKSFYVNCEIHAFVVSCCCFSKGKKKPVGKHQLLFKVRSLTPRPPRPLSKMILTLYDFFLWLDRVTQIWIFIGGCSSLHLSYKLGVYRLFFILREKPYLAPCLLRERPFITSRYFSIFCTPLSHITPALLPGHVTIIFIYYVFLVAINKLVMLFSMKKKNFFMQF